MRKLAVVLLCCTGLLLAGYASFRAYKVWKQGHMMKLAREFVTKSDGRNAVLCLQQVLRANPRNLEACRLMAELSMASRSPGALIWWNRVVELNPRSAEDRLALAGAAVVFRAYGLATNALAGIDPAQRQTAAYHNVAGTVAAEGNLASEAASHYSEACRLDPTNPVPRLNLAVVRLHGSNELDLAEARIALQRIVADPKSISLRCQALRELIADAVHTRQTNTALELAKTLQSQTNAGFPDRLLRLELLRQTKSAEFASALSLAEREASTNAAKVHEMTVWQMTRIPTRDTLAWLTSLPDTIRTNQPVPFLTADCQSLMQDWRGLQNVLTNRANYWGELEFLRHAFMVRALRGQGLDAAAKGEWEEALRATGGGKQGLNMLLQMAAQWKWESEAEELLWTIVNRYPEEHWAYQALSQVLYINGRTRPLMKLFSQELKRSPSNLEIKNNLAVTALLLDANELKPHDLAREVYETAKTNASYVSTYAFSLHVQKNDAEALKVLESLSPRDLEKPSIAGYYGLVLKDAGNPAKAKVYLGLSSKAKVLPEERKLFDKALAGV